MASKKDLQGPRQAHVLAVREKNPRFKWDILRWVAIAFGVALLASVVIVVLCLPMFARTREVTPWYREMHHLQAFGSDALLVYSERYKEWPENIGQMVVAFKGKPSRLKYSLFTDPDTGQKTHWMLLPPANVIDQMDHVRTIIAACPRAGGPGKGSMCRLVLFEDGRTWWIWEKDYQARKPLSVHIW